MSSTDRAPDYDDKTDEAAVPPRAGIGRAPVLEPNEARQGATHQNVRYVLGFGIAGVVIVFFLVYWAFFAGSAPPPVGG